MVDVFRSFLPLVPRNQEKEVQHPVDSLQLLRVATNKRCESSDVAISDGFSSVREHINDLNRATGSNS